MAVPVLLWFVFLVPLLAQVPLLAYLYHKMEVESEVRTATGGGVESREFDHGGRPPHRPDASPGQCRECGADNATGYQYCWNCVSRLY